MTQEQEKTFSSKLRKAILGVNTISIVASVFIALLLGALIVAAFDMNVREAASYFFSQPSDTFAAVNQVIYDFFSSIFVGSIYNPDAASFAEAIRPLTETATLSVPLIFAGLSVAVAFRAGLFNIGAQGQLLVGAICAGIVGFSISLPYGLHLVVAIIAAIIGGALWGFVPGILKAYTGAHEVVVTIMMNFIAVYLLAYLLHTPFFIGNGSIGKSQIVKKTAIYPIFFSGSRLHLGFILALLTAVLVWWILERSTFGFELRAAGANPYAAKSAGINVKRVITLTMVLAGALAGLAATGPVMGTSLVLTDGVAGTYGFDAITVALLGRSGPLGVVLAALLFGAMQSGASTMQAAAGIPVDIVQVVQAIIILLVAASEYIQYKRGTKAPTKKKKKAKKVAKTPLAANESKEA